MPTRVPLVLGGDEEGGPIAARRREIARAALVEDAGGHCPQLLNGRAVRGHGQHGRVAQVGIEPEGGDAAADLALVEPVVLEILEEVAREPELGRGHGAPP
jgi:hypothetical protein